MEKQRIEPAVDERVAQESSRQMAKCFRMAMIANVILLAVKGSVGSCG